MTVHTEKHCKGEASEKDWYIYEFHDVSEAQCIPVPGGVDGRSVYVGCDFKLPKGGDK